MYNFDDVADDSLIERLKALVARDSVLLGQLLAHIGEADARKLYLQQGCSSMFTYCVERLNCSEGEAYKRIHAARAARKYPLIFELVSNGALHLSGVNVLAPELSEENHRELLHQASRKSKRAIEELVRARAPRPDVPELLRKLPVPPVQMSVPLEAALPSAPIAPPKPVPPKPAPRPVVAPLAEDRFKLQLTMSRALKEKIDTAKALLRHQVPGGDLEKVLECALDELLATLMKKRFANTVKPKAASVPANHARHIPAAVKREVAARDGLRCTYVSADGHRCSERAFLELDHREPFAKGGAATVENIRMRCRAHNAHDADLAYGRDFMRRKKRLAPAKVQTDSCPIEQLSLDRASARET